MFKQYVKAILLVAAAGIAQFFANQVAYNHRGYWAVGGEFFIFPVVVIIGYYLLGLAKHEREKEETEGAEIISFNQYRDAKKGRGRKESIRG